MDSYKLGESHIDNIESESIFDCFIKNWKQKLISVLSGLDNFDTVDARNPYVQISALLKVVFC